ncbi:hypothetical protein N9L68_07615 [bacterium]|nr:hypothetical protein [bacterium]
MATQAVIGISKSRALTDRGSIPTHHTHHALAHLNEEGTRVGRHHQRSGLASPSSCRNVGLRQSGGVECGNHAKAYTKKDTAMPGNSTNPHRDQ